MVAIGTGWTDITGGDYWTDQTPAGIAYWRVLGKATVNSSARTARVDFKWQVSYSIQGATVWNSDSHSYSITCTDNGGSGHSATSTWAFGTFGYNWEDRGVGGDNYWANVKYKTDGTASFSATFSGARWNNNSFSWTTTVSLPSIGAASYTVTYNANGGTGAPSAQTKTASANLVLSSDIPTWSNHAFQYWNTAQYGTGTTYYPGGTYSTNANVTLYAQWRELYTITYNANGGSGAPSSFTKTQGRSEILSTVTPTRSGYTFFRWNTASDGTGQDYSPGALFERDATTTLYAIWIPNGTAPTGLFDCYTAIKGAGQYTPCFIWIKVGSTWYFVKKTAINVGGTWKTVSNKG